MSFTVIITRDMEDRFSGFLSSAMQEVAPGTYLSPKQSPAVRDRIWLVLEDWFQALGRGGAQGGSILMAWGDNGKIGGLGLKSLGLPPRTLSEVDGLLLVCRVPQIN